ncbi:hypothetical protein [Acetoanaerobium noterae]|uniref:hypothetical protein n=1 Tax=Acetoanaerobium noterae TaxID=745369 RepID=UPI0028A7FF69|nr:hypothetical protein [Acetoanaerobium noterae]
MIYVVMMYVMLMIIGAPISYKILPDKYKKYFFEFSFILGTMISMLEASYASYLGYNMNTFKYIFIVQIIISGIYFIYLLINKKIKFGKENMIISAILLIAGFIGILPLVLFNAYNVFGDGFTYIAIADYLLNYSYFDTAEIGSYHAVNSQMFLYQQAGFRMGTQFLLSLMTALFGGGYSFYYFMQVTSIGHMFTVTAIYLFSRVALKHRFKTSAILSVVSAFHVGIFVVVAYYGFLPQVYGIGGAVIVFMLLFLFDEWLKYKNFYISLIIISASSLILSYSEIVPFVALSYIIFIVFEILKKRITRGLLKFMVILIVGIFLVSNVALFNLLKALKIQTVGIYGWNVKNTLAMYLQNIASVTPIYNGWSMTSELGWSFLLAIITIIFITMVLYGSRIVLKDVRNRKYYITMMVPFIVLLVYFTFFKMNPHVEGTLGHTWNISKLVQYYAFSFIIIFGIAYDEILESSKSGSLKTMISIFLIGYIIINSGMAYQQSNATAETMRVFTGNRSNPIEEYEKMIDKYNGIDRPIYLEIDKKYQTHKQMLAYFLKDSVVYSDWSDCPYISFSIPEEEKNVDITSDSIILKTNENDKERIANTIEIMKDKAIFFEFIDGVYSEEVIGDKKWYWAYGDSIIKIDNLTGKEADVKLSFNIDITATSKKNEVLKLSYDGKEIISQKISPGMLNEITANIKVPDGISEVMISYSGNAVKIGSDPRDLSYSISNYKLDLN